MMELAYMHSLYICNHILYITYIPMYISICPDMIYILNSRHVGRAKLVLLVNPIFFLVHGASVESPLD